MTQSISIKDDFFAALPVFDGFEGVTDDTNYRRLPDGWLLALADIVHSTEAIASGRYKAVNMAGASVISAIVNALGKGNYPFVFGGDGAIVAIPAAGEPLVRKALADVQTWVSEELQLDLRAAVVPLSDIRRAGLDVMIARFSPSKFVSYAMFSGGGTSWAEAQMKAGNYSIAPAPAHAQPDLSGLSCRWNPIKARNGQIVSIIVVPGSESKASDFQDLVSDIIAISKEQDRDGHPVPREGPVPILNFDGVDPEARTDAAGFARIFRKLAIAAQIGLVYVINKFGIRTGAFDVNVYRSDLAANSDFRKFDDGLKMTLDVDHDRLKRIEARLLQAEAEGTGLFGLHRQNSALMTCFVPTPMSRDHMHFIDGAEGGYAMAASMLGPKLQKPGVTGDEPRH